MTTRRIGKRPSPLQAAFVPQVRSLNRDQYSRIKLPVNLFTEPVTKKLQEHYPKLSVERNKRNVVLNTSKLSKPELSDLVTDIDFYQENPLVAIENICCRLDNFKPKDKTQKEALESAVQLLNYTGPNPAGLFLQGDTGVGKTHLSVALAKEFMKTGLKTLYVTNKSIHDASKNLQEVEVVIIDDYNSGYGSGDYFRDIVDYIHRKGGRLFVTSNSSYGKVVLDESFVGAEQELPRFKDRTKSMFKFHHITGPSQRLADAWFK